MTTWYTWDISLQWLVKWGQISWISEPLIYHVTPTKDSHVLLLLDSHDSNIMVPAISKCWENGVIMVTFPLHTSYKLQPLSRCVFAHLRTFTMWQAVIEYWSTQGNLFCLECWPPSWSGIPKSFHFVWYPVWILHYWFVACKFCYIHSRWVFKFIVNGQAWTSSSEIGEWYYQHHLQLLSSPRSLQEIWPFPKAQPKTVNNKINDENKANQ
jgi:hypothetical protein